MPWVGVTLKIMEFQPHCHEQLPLLNAPQDIAQSAQILPAFILTSH